MLQKFCICFNRIQIGGGQGQFKSKIGLMLSNLQLPVQAKVVAIIL